MFNLPQKEQEILKFWKNQNIFKKSLTKESPKGDFVFYEGPPTANGKPGIHHILARAFKDLIPRYKTMQGYHVERKAGWDTHGLPVELEVEKELGLKNKKDVEKYEIGKFNKKCKESVWKYKEDWEKMTERIGFWIDMEHPYITYENKYIESLWWIIKQAHNKGLLYKGYKVIPQCPRCGTALSSHEVAQGYKNVREESVYIKFKIQPRALKAKSKDAIKNLKLENLDNAYILAWTTTPWTLPGNVALAVGEKINYAILRNKSNNEIYILAKDRIADVLKYHPEKESNYKFIKEIKGKDLVGLKYKPLFPGVITDKTKNAENAFKVYPANFVSTEDGTGVVHTAVMYGMEDYELGEKVGLPKVHTVNLDGTFNHLVPQWQGRFVKDVEKDIIKNLKEKNLLFKTEIYAHDYPFCWRCQTPLIYYAKDSWYFRISKLKKELLKNNSKINWVPAHIKEGRFGEWLKDVKDWAISRERYWGTPLPIWECRQTGEKQNTKNKKQAGADSRNGCGNLKVIGSLEELQKLSGKKLEDLHRPYIDKITFKCDKCGGIMKRVPEVMDCWFDSGSMPFAQWHYPFENSNLIDCGSNKQEPSLKNKKRSCRFPADFIAEGVDQTRGWFYTLLAVATMLGKEAPYKNVICLGHILDKNGQKMSKHLGNVIDPWKIINKYGADSVRWYLYTINQAGEPKKFAEEGLKKASGIFVTLFNTLTFYKMFSDNYQPSNITFNNLNNILDKWIIIKLNLLIKEVSENLENYKITSSARKISGFITDLSQWYLRRSRKRFKNSDENDKKQALYTLHKALFELSKLLAPFAPFTAEYIYQEISNTAKESVHLENWPKYKNEILNQKILDYMETTRKVVELGLAKRAEASIKVRQPLPKLTIINRRLPEEYIELIKDEVNVKEVAFSQDKSKELSTEISTEITPELRQEGSLRELIRIINNLRKKEGLTIQDKIKIEYYTPDKELKDVFEKYKNELKQQTLAVKLDESRSEFENIKINGKKLGLRIEKIKK